MERTLATTSVKKNQTVDIPESRIEELRRIVGDRNVLTELHERAIRAATPFPFRIDRWQDYLPDIIVMPGSTEEVSEMLKFANTYGIPIVPRAGGTGLNDGAVPLRKGIVLDIKRMNEILEVDSENMTATVQAGINNQELSRALKPLDPLVAVRSCFFSCVTYRREHRHWCLVTYRWCLRTHSGPSHKHDSGSPDWEDS